MSTPSLSPRIYSVPKAGGADADCEDAAAISAEDWPVYASVADGATESAFSGLWARMLVEEGASRTGTDEAAFRMAVKERRADWRTAVAERAADGPWYVQAKAEEGAFAAVLSLSLQEDGTWTALSVGDCCLLLLRDGHVRRSWPFEDPEAFTNRPPLVASRPDEPVPSPQTASGTWTHGDTVLLATDAVAAWLLQMEDVDVEDGGQAAFRGAVDSARENGSLRNDDVTLLVLEPTSPPEADE
jgi:serine/threonine protein phosphatase PrpC